jgi:hypothetical protein
MPGGGFNYEDVFERYVPLTTHMGTEEEWFDTHTLDSFIKKNSIKINEVARDGKTVLRKFSNTNSLADVNKTLLEAGLIKVQGNTSALNRLTGSNEFSGGMLRFPKPQEQQQQQPVQPTAPSTLQFVNAADSLRTLPADLLTPATPPVVSVNNVADFSILGLDFISDAPQEPNVRVTFEFEHGEYESFYHAVIYAGAVVYLIFDTRWRYGRFIPKSKGLTTMCIDGTEVKGVFWTDALFELGVMKITPFILAVEDSEPEKEERVADF